MHITVLLSICRTFRFDRGIRIYFRLGDSLRHGTRFRLCFSFGPSFCLDFCTCFLSGPRLLFGFLARQFFSKSFCLCLCPRPRLCLSLGLGFCLFLRPRLLFGPGLRFGFLPRQFFCESVCLCLCPRPRLCLSLGLCLGRRLRSRLRFHLRPHYRLSRCARRCIFWLRCLLWSYNRPCRRLTVLPNLFQCFVFYILVVLFKPIVSIVSIPHRVKLPISKPVFLVKLNATGVVASTRSQAGGCDRWH